MKRERQPQSNSFLWLLDDFQEKFTSQKNLDPSLLLTDNRKDISLRIDFLTQVIKNNQDPKQTMYFKFISDPEKGILRESVFAIKHFLELFSDVKNNGIHTPILVSKFSSDMISTRYIQNNQKIWSKIQNKTGFQLMDGAHRLSVALFLKHDNIPVKIIKSFGFEIPNYTEFLKKKEKEYL